MTVFQVLICAAIGYLLGNVQSGLIVGKLLAQQDIRNHGSGSSGATNALRVLGKRSALLTLLGDLLKGIIAAWLGKLIGGLHGGMVAALAVTVGHIWPAFYGFRGGKGVVTSIGVMFVLLPGHAAMLLAAGVAVLLLTKIVSLGSIAGAITLFVTGTISAIARRDGFMFFFVLLMTGIVLYAHRENIKRIRNGTENKISAEMFKR